MATFALCARRRGVQEDKLYLNLNPTDSAFAAMQLRRRGWQALLVSLLPLPSLIGWAGAYDGAGFCFDLCSGPFGVGAFPCVGASIVSPNPHDPTVCFCRPRAMRNPDDGAGDDIQGLHVLQWVDRLLVRSANMRGPCVAGPPLKFGGRLALPEGNGGVSDQHQRAGATRRDTRLGSRHGVHCSSARLHAADGSGVGGLGDGGGHRARRRGMLRHRVLRPIDWRVPVRPGL